jgi:hypothetical protein
MTTLGRGARLALACALAACGGNDTAGAGQGVTDADAARQSDAQVAVGGDAQRTPSSDGAVDVDVSSATDTGRPVAGDALRPAADAPAADARPTDARVTDASPTPDAALARPCVATVALDGYEIFAFEASHPDATAAERGVDAAGVCSRPGVLPWTDLTVAQARTACETIGFSLCTNAQWQAACSGPDMNLYPYGGPHVDALCNDHIAGGNALEPTGQRPDCHTPTGIYDQSGNVWEMTAEGERRGGSWRVNASTYQQEYAGCFESLFINEQYADADLGFRCCRER